MASTYSTPGSRGLALCSWLLSLGGLIFYWWVPLGMVLSLSGLTTAFIAWVQVPRHGRRGLALGALLFAAAVLVADCLAVWYGLDTLRFSALR
jgi:hypothetical protein